IHFLERFLHPVFSEIDLPAVGGGSDVVGAESLGDGDEPDGGRVAPRPASRVRDAIANVSQPGAERGGICHAPRGGYLTSGFKVVTLSCACLAFGPLGASLRYVSNSFTASAKFASPTRTFPR